VQTAGSKTPEAFAAGFKFKNGPRCRQRPFISASKRLAIVWVRNRRSGAMTLIAVANVGLPNAVGRYRHLGAKGVRARALGVVRPGWAAYAASWHGWGWQFP